MSFSSSPEGGSHNASPLNTGEPFARDSARPTEEQAFAAGPGSFGSDPALETGAFGETERLPVEPVADDQASPSFSRGTAFQNADDPVATLDLREEELVAHKEMRELGEVVVRTEVKDVPGRLEVDAYREEVQVEHVPMGQVVTERREPWEEDGALIVPVYEEQLVVVKRLVLREQLRVRRVGVTERQLFEDTLRKETASVDDPERTGLVQEIYPRQENDRERDAAAHPSDGAEHEGFLENLGRKIFQ